MNYVPVVDAGTSSTNFSGTKDAASQDVNKDVSSLRYIDLPNYGNSNPTTTSTNPSVDQLETLTVESVIPTVSSPVPTTCLDDSLEPSNDTHGVEADLCNMENNISASPTPTFKTHKDHLKSQIIGHVATLIQTGTKSKEEEPKKISDALKDPSWIEAMQEELLQFKIQNVWILVDCPEGKKDGIFLSQDKYVGDILKKFIYSDVRSTNTPMDKENPWGKDGTAYSDSDYGGATQDRKSTTRGCQFLGRRLISWQCKKQTIVATSTTKEEYVAAASGCGQVLWIQNQLLDYGKVRALMYLTASRLDIMHATCFCARYQAQPTEKHLIAIKRIFWYLKDTIHMGLWYPKDTGFKLTAFSDSDHAGCLDSHKSTSGGIQFLGGDKLVSWSSKKQDCTSISSVEVETEYQLADVFTKALAEERFKYLIRRLGMRCLTPEELEVLA
nr:uncharacterized mitochondrial protein AtMg00810-like [Tanacetum cinerariifolium]